VSVLPSGPSDCPPCGGDRPSGKAAGGPVSRDGAQGFDPATGPTVKDPGGSLLVEEEQGGGDE
jgi:hypothetical protein